MSGRAWRCTSTTGSSSSRTPWVSYGIADDTDSDGTNEWTNEDAWVLAWTSSGLSWSEGDSVLLTLVTLPAGGL